jgi:hypothetical protein
MSLCAPRVSRAGRCVPSCPCLARAHTPYKRAVQKRFTVGKRLGRLTNPRAGLKVLGFAVFGSAMIDGFTTLLDVRALAKVCKAPCRPRCWPAAALARTDSHARANLHMLCRPEACPLAAGLPALRRAVVAADRVPPPVAS